MKIKILFAFAVLTVFAWINFPANLYAKGRIINVYKYFSHRTLKEIYVITRANPKEWALTLSDVSNAVIFSNSRFINFKIDVVAYGPGGIQFLMKEYDKKNYPTIQSLHTYGVKFIACHTTMKTLHIKPEQLFNFVKIAYPGAVFYIAKKEMQGFAYIKSY